MGEAGNKGTCDSPRHRVGSTSGFQIGKAHSKPDATEINTLKFEQ